MAAGVRKSALEAGGRKAEGLCLRFVLWRVGGELVPGDFHFDYCALPVQLE